MLLKHSRPYISAVPHEHLLHFDLNALTMSSKRVTVCFFFLMLFNLMVDLGL
uniref:Uncharacterized protein n=1 Tax=Rhizophora mucronata TaxID=61149 RepID=A0A2P2NB17_RHIMU